MSKPWDWDFYAKDEDPNAKKLFESTFSKGVIAPHESLIITFLLVAFFIVKVLKISINCSSIIAYRYLILKYVSPPCPVI